MRPYSTTSRIGWWTRRTFLKSGVAVCAAGLPIGARSAPQPAVLYVGFLALQDPANSGHWIAADRQLFEREGIRPEIFAGGPNSPPLLTLLAARKIDIARATWFSVLDAVAKGNDFVVIAAGYPQNATCLMSLPKNPIRTPTDIVDKRLLLQFKNYSEIIDAVLKSNRLPARYSVSPTGYSVDALLAGDGDGYFAYSINAPVILSLRGLRQDRDFFVAPLRDMQYDVPDQLYVVRRETLASNRNMLLSYLRAVLRGMSINSQDPTVAVKLLTERYAVDSGIDPKAQLLTNRAYIPLSSAPGGKGPLWFSDAHIDRMYQFASVSGRAVVPGRSRLIDLSVLDDAIRTA